MKNELKTEKRYPYSKPIDKLELNEAIELMIKEQKHSISTLIKNKKILDDIIINISSKLSSLVKEDLFILVLGHLAE